MRAFSTENSESDPCLKLNLGMNIPKVISPKWDNAGRTITKATESIPTLSICICLNKSKASS
ncbi:hypothetical protein AMTR_s00010p00015250 [Amborella trichopoda]|uniref:Uncharacterized protein n=1 Tax=Amborella trichopoda TaxID=13333 RepID=W1NF10_AMBTC|nr:hypothetical protein AMTR_s00010p00015250 [Amborella trichopoda]